MKEREIKEERMQIKNERDQQRKKMLEDIQNKKKELGGGGKGDIKVEMVVPSFMQLEQYEEEQ